MVDTSIRTGFWCIILILFGACTSETPGDGDAGETESYFAGDTTGHTDTDADAGTDVYADADTNADAARLRYDISDIQKQPFTATIDSLEPSEARVIKKVHTQI